MTNGFMPQQTNGAQPQFAQPQPQQQYQPPAQQPAQFGAPQQTGGYFNQPQPGNVPPQFAQPTPAQMPQQYQPPAEPASVEDTEGYFSGGAAWISWDSDKGYRDGTPRGGMIIGKRIVNQTDIETGQVRYQSKGDTSKPLTMLVLELQTGERVDPDDDGKRNMPVRAGLRKAAKEAFEAVGSKDLEIGGYFYAARLRKEPIPNSTFKRNIFSALYARPGSPDPMAGQPAYQAPTPPPAAPQIYNPAVAPEPSAPMEQFAAHAAYQQAQGAPAGFASPQPQQPSAQPGQWALNPAAAQQGVAQFSPAAAQQQFEAHYAAPQLQPANHYMPDPQLAAQAQGVPAGFAPQQPAQPQQPGFQPGAQPNGYVPTAPSADLQQQPGQWSPFSS